VNGVLYLIGPSNVGKSSAADQLAADAVVVHIDLDRLLAERDAARPLCAVAQDWAIVGPVLAALDDQEADLPVVVTIGAGTQDMDREHRNRRLETWLRARSNRVIYVAGDPDELFARSEAHRGHRDRFDHLEYGPDRQRLYDGAGITVFVAGLERLESIRKIESAIREVLSRL
jgi:hypothetical protein